MWELHCCNLLASCVRRLAHEDGHPREVRQLGIWSQPRNWYDRRELLGGGSSSRFTLVAVNEHQSDLGTRFRGSPQLNLQGVGGQ